MIPAEQVLPQIEDGRISWADSPLVRAVTEGRVLVVDEADKAPLEVVPQWLCYDTLLKYISM